MSDANQHCVAHNNAMDRLDAFATFSAVAEAGGLAAAARRLGKSPAVVTRTLQALELELGARLVRRTTRVVSLTEVGAKFLVDVRRILLAVETSVASVRGDDGRLSGGIVITAPVMFGRLYVAPIVLRFLRAHPEVSVRASYMDRVVDLAEESVDVAVRIAHLRDSSWRAARVGTVRSVLCAAPTYLQERAPLEQPEDLGRHDVVAFAPAAAGATWTFRRARRAHRVAVRPRLTTNSTDATIAAAVAGLGIIRALSYQVADEIKRGRLVILLSEWEPPPIPIHVLHAGSATTHRARALVDLAVEKLRADPRMKLALESYKK